MIQVNTSLLSSNLFRVITNKNLNGKIHSCFQNALNIELEDEFLFNILPEEIPLNPRSLVVPMIEWKRIRDRLLSIGMVIQIKGDHLAIPASDLSISFGKSKLWDPTPSLPGPPLPDAEIHQNLETVKKIVQENSKNEHIENLLFRSCLRKAVNYLFISISNRKFEDVSKSSLQLIGLGPGLTPSGDDVLSGIMAAGVFCSLAYKSLYFDIKEINSNIIFNVNSRTTTYSQNMLLDSAVGEVVRPVGELLQGLLCGCGKASLASFTYQVMALGESSGTDMLEGILLGMEAFLRLKDKIVQQDNKRRDT